MFVLVAIIQALSGLGLIFLVLLHSGKGGGLSDMFGGGIGARPLDRPWWSRTLIGSPCLRP